jgi:metal-dependent amidase/aminoacylase/carboxypeptidase family protein
MTSKLIILFAAMTIQFNSLAQLSTEIEDEVKKQTALMTELCKQLHQNPELSLQEFETSKRMAAELRKAGFKVTENFGGNNVVGILKNGEGP